MSEVFLKTPLGILRIEGDSAGLVAVEFVDEELPQSETIPDELSDSVNQIREYFDGKRTTFDLKLNPQGTDFQKRVWQELAQIPFGKTTSYLQMAKNLGDPKVIRAAASANGKNPISIIIPCHRVIGSDNSMTGYAGGIWRKKWLLEHESPVTQQRLF
ncbi:methylated-DNA--[protein]-cysteine S-methyltransferase [Leeuwenhoekiella marinoflava]|mgnify:CR=1 FL=1|uniref:Methylated-DNA--protein-cysteine methyltransferase n=2 Tax=Leeuwenhoekiella marinoflava TaxID=988 RepID=A0A4Q0P9A1_9FLAO|nr:methylated-DNA--[protein]-cysteine S-methyltransferase [Leeuwenhoekiella marinoflava]RXG23121.1 methylated-DNA-[protein]-cysteine S-methyltransferase [Leeuwenhoekiella marinoflava]SHE31293.1 methylated-DNA-[protein]-cysteine S-methyltransferase [Leeuwenhoekiella marinoflava DSM 3653]